MSVSVGSLLSGLDIIGLKHFYSIILPFRGKA